MKLVWAMLVAACTRRPAITSCDADLHGVWVTPSGARWMMLDNGATLEAYPMFDDAIPRNAGIEGAPRALDLSRGEKLAGAIKRRYMQGGDTCEAQAPIRIAKCKDDALQVVLADVPAPLSFAPCEWPRPAPSRVEWWKRD
jgi:hypothetical protein